MVAVIGEAAVALRPETSRFASEAENEVDSKMPGIARKAAGFFAAAFAAVKVVGFFGDAINEASDLSESASKVGVVFGGAAEQVNAFAANSARSLGISESAALGATGTFGNLLRSVGLTEQGAADMSTGMVQLAADLASFNNTDSETALDALRAGLLGEAEPLKQFGVNLNSAAIEAKAVALGIADTGDELTDAQKAQAAYALIMEQTTLAQGDFSRTSGGLANQQRILKAEFANVSAQVGTALLPALSAIGTFILDRVLPFVQELAAKFRDDVVPALQQAAEWIQTNVLPALQQLGDWLVTNVLPVLQQVAEWVAGTLVPALIDFGFWLRDNATAVGIIAGVIGLVLLPHLIRLAAQAVITRVTTAALWAAQKVGAITSAAASVASTYSIIAAWVAQRVAAAVSFGQTIALMALYAAESVANAARAVAAWVVGSAQVVAALVAQGAAFVAQGARAVASVAVTVATTVGGWLVMAASALAGAASMALAWIIAFGPIALVIAAVVGLVVVIVRNWDTIKAATMAVFGAIWGFIQAVWDGIVGGIQAAVSFIWGLITGYFNLYYSIISGVFNAVVGAVSAAWGAITGAVGAALGFLSSVIQSGVNTALGFFTSLPGRILGALAGIGNLLFGLGGDLIQGFVNGISAAAGFVGNIARNLANSVIGFLNSAIDGINDLLEFTIPVPGLPDIHINPPNLGHIPRFHSGGVFASGGGEGLALLRDQERIATPEQRVIADNLLADLLDGRLAAPAPAAAAQAGPSVVNNITQLPGEDGSVLAARVTQGTVWNLNNGITRRVGAGAGLP